MPYNPVFAPKILTFVMAQIGLSKKAAGATCRNDIWHNTAPLVVLGATLRDWYANAADEIIII